MRVHIIFDLFLKMDGKSKSIGGVETYLTNLSTVFKEKGYAVSVYQIGDTQFEKEIDGVTVYGYPIPKDGNRAKKLLEKCKKYFDYEKDIVIFGNDLISCPAPGMRSITIQHGIFWDIPRAESRGRFKYFLRYIVQCMEGWGHIKKVGYSNMLVCVDYNFVNWYRAVTPFPKTKMVVIPNFTSIAPPFNKPTQEDPGQPVRIIFARRFWDFRGTRIFMEAAKRLLAKYNNIEIILAGDGLDEKLLRKELDKYSNVHFITYASHESLDIHSDKDIAVIPTLASEGTSLSLLEAMSAQCAVICTNVGGMTNIVIDGYNGLMISPLVDELYEAMATLIENTALRKLLADKAYETVKSGFSIEKWKTSWGHLIESMEE